MKGYKPIKYNSTKGKILHCIEVVYQTNTTLLRSQEMLKFNGITHEFIKFYFPIMNARNLDQTFLKIRYIDRCINIIIKTGLNERG